MPDHSNLQIGSWRFLPRRNQLAGPDGATVELLPRAVAALAYLASRAGETVSRSELVANAWEGSVVTDNAVDRVIAQLRAALGDDARSPRYIRTISKQGYCLIAQVRAASGSRRSLLATPGALWLSLTILALGAYLVLPTPGTGRAAPMSPDGLWLSTPGPKHSLAISPDGFQWVLGWSPPSGQATDLALMRRGDQRPTPLPPHPGLEVAPAWSPDGDQIAFASMQPDQCSLHLLSVHDRAHRPLGSCGIGFFTSLAWSVDGQELFFATRPGRGEAHQIMSIEPVSGVMRQRTYPDPMTFGDYAVSTSPDGQTLAFLRSDRWSHSEIWLLDLDAGASRHLKTLRHVIFSLAWLDSMHLVYAPGPGHNQLTALNHKSGETRQLVSHSRRLAAPQRVAVENALVAAEITTDSNLVLATRAGDTLNSLPPGINSTQREWQPVYSTDGQMLAFLSDRTGHPELFVAHFESGRVEQISNFRGQSVIHTFRWSDNDRSLIVAGSEDAIMQLDLANQELNPLTPAGEYASHPIWHPNGQELLYTSDASGNWEIWSLDVVSGHRRPITDSGGLAARVGFDGSVYVTKFHRDGIWKVGSESTEDTQVIPSVAPGALDQWEYVAPWLYFAVIEDGQLWLARAEPGTNDQQRLFPLPNEQSVHFSFSVHPDNRHVVYSRVDRRETEYLVFR